jgi:hypothetical protein
VVVDNLHVQNAFIRPHETQAPLVVDADAVLPLPVTRQHLRQLPGGARSDSRLAAACNCVSLRSATLLMLANRRDFPVANSNSVSAHLNERIMAKVYTDYR